MPIPAVLMIVFNRPDHARKVFEKVRAVRPPKLYIAVDGPRKNRHDDQVKIRQTIKLFDEVDWPCEVKKLVRVENMGLPAGPSARPSAGSSNRRNRALYSRMIVSLIRPFLPIADTPAGKIQGRAVCHAYQRRQFPGWQLAGNRLLLFLKNMSCMGMGQLEKSMEKI